MAQFGNVSTARRVRIGCGQGFWGDDLEAPLALVKSGQLDYLVMDFLAEITMSILQKQKKANPELGYATDVVGILRDVLPEARQRGTKIVTNAGGVNPLACARAVARAAAELGFDGIRIGVVSGDDLMDGLDDLARNSPMANMDTGEEFASVAGKVISANAYLGSEPVRNALSQGADIVICGRVTDTALTLGPLMHEYGWKSDQWDLLAAGIVAAHLIECGSQVTGGNHQAAWQTVEGLDRVGSPIVEVDATGVITLTKPVGSGGAVTVATATEQLLYEIGDPTAVLTPDVTVDWRSFTVAQDGPDRVVVHGVRGSEPPPTLKASIAYEDGFSTFLMWPYTWPDTLEKARAAGEIIEAKVKRLELDLDESRVDVFGAGAIHGPRRPGPPIEPREVIVRYAARSHSRAAIERLSKEVAPMIFGPPGLAGFIGGGRGRVSEIVSYWPTLIPRESVTPRVEMVEP